MQIHHIGYGIRGFYKLAKLGQLWDMIPKEAQYRLRVLRFWKKYGLEATREAFGVSRRTLYRWQARLRAARGDPIALQPKKPIPRRRRQSQWPKEVIDHIRYLRERYPNLGKARVHVLLEPWCEQRGLRCPSVSTIGRIISRAPDKMRHVPMRLDARGRPKPVRRRKKLRRPRGIEAGALEFWAVDLVERVREGMRRYVLTMVDPVSRVAFAVAVPGKGARYAAKVLGALLGGNPWVRSLLSDNGSEFEELLPLHHSLGLKPPVRWLLENHPECQRLWTNTNT